MAQKKRLILGSESSGRRRVLDELSSELQYTVMTPDIDERKIRSNNPVDLTRALALAKAGAILPRLKEPCVLITADQVVLWHGEVREKPRGAEEARQFLRSYGSGDPVRHVTSVCVTEYVPGDRLQQRIDTDEAFVEFLPIPPTFIDDILRRGTVFSCAGAVAVEDPGISPHIKRIWNSYGPPDAWTSVQGLPRFRTLKMLQSLGVF